MATFDINQIDGGVEAVAGDLTISVTDLYADRGAVRGTLRVHEGDVLRLSDRVNLTAAAGCKKAIAAATGRGADLSDDLLLALDDAGRQRLQRTPSPPEAAPVLDGPPPPLSDLLDSIRAFLLSYIVFPLDEQADAVALWIAHTHVFEQFELSPILSITSPEKRSGKSRLLDCLALLCARPWGAVLPSEAVVYRKIAADAPTLLLDEVDAVFGPKTASPHEGLRAMLNAGNRQGASVPRVVGEAMEVVDFSIFTPKAVAGIGRLPDTVADRAIPIRMRRKAGSEAVRKFRTRAAKAEVAPIVAALIHYGTALEIDGETYPDVPEALNDRAADSWEPLIMLADAAGGEWSARARASALKLSMEEVVENLSLGVRLLADIHSVLASWTGPDDGIWSSDLISMLRELEEAPWDDLYGRPLTQNKLSSLLREFGIRSKNIRRATTVRKGYATAGFDDAFARYLVAPTPPENGGQTATPLQTGDPRYESEAEAPAQGAVGEPLHSGSNRYTATDPLPENGHLPGSSDANPDACSGVAAVAAPEGVAGEKEDDASPGGAEMELEL